MRMNDCRKGYLCILALSLLFGETLKKICITDLSLYSYEKACNQIASGAIK